MPPYHRPCPSTPCPPARAPCPFQCMEELRVLIAYRAKEMGEAGGKVLGVCLSSRKNMCIHQTVMDRSDDESVDVQCRDMTVSQSHNTTRIAPSTDRTPCTIYPATHPPTHPPTRPPAHPAAAHRPRGCAPARPSPTRASRPALSTSSECRDGSPPARKPPSPIHQPSAGQRCPAPSPLPSPLPSIA
jgi:hypothetical protein